jgi:hypothetical protein
MPERFYAVDHKNGDIMAVTCKQVGVSLDIDLVQFVQLGTVSFRYLFLHHFTKVTAGFAVQDDLNLILHSHRQLRALAQYPLANSVVIDV